MDIEQQLTYLEKGAKKDLADMGPKERMTYYQQLKEYIRPKMTRTAIEKSSELPEKIELVVIHEKPKKDEKSS